MATNSMNMSDRPSRRGRSAAADPVLDAVRKEDLESLHIRIPPNLRKAVKLRSVEDGVSIQEWVTQAIHAKLE